MAPGKDFNTNLPVKDALFMLGESSRLSGLPISSSQGGIQTLGSSMVSGIEFAPVAKWRCLHYLARGCVSQ